MSWSYTAGRHGHRVRVFERLGRTNLYASVWDPEAGEVVRSLGHADREKAQDYADDLAVQLRRGEEELRRRGQEQKGATVDRVFRIYLRDRSPDKGEYMRRADERHAALWTRVLGSGFDLANVSRRVWDRFLRERASGAIDARGRPVAPADRKEVGPRTVAQDCVWLCSVCRWAMRYRDTGDRRLLREDPTVGLEIPKEKNPARPVATHDRVDRIREVYREPRMQYGGELVETYLPEIFELVVGTGRRVSAVCGLRFEDLDLERTEGAPYGAITWPADTDKMGREWRCPIAPRVREALEAAIRKRRRVGPGPLFPDPGDPETSVGYYKAATWLRAAERKAELEPQDGSLWHAYRRLWASSRKDLLDVDVAKAGGWSSLEALKSAYQRPDDETMLRVVTHETELREVR